MIQNSLLLRQAYNFKEFQNDTKVLPYPGHWTPIQIYFLAIIPSNHLYQIEHKMKPWKNGFTGNCTQ